jgi:tetratricopeptide (TPR) repeat protein
MNHLGQHVENFGFSPQPTELLEDLPNGNRILVWKQKCRENTRQEIFYYDFDLTYQEVSLKIDPSKVIRCDTDSVEYKRYTISEGWLDITDEIRAKAKEIVGKEANTYYIAKKIFDWVVDNFQYEYPDFKARGASKSLKRLKGDCGEFSAVFVSLCRSQGVPARTVTCNWFKGGGHQWAEVYLPPYEWVPVDTTLARRFKYEPESAIALRAMQIAGIKCKDPDWFFGNLYPYRLICLIGENIKVKSSAAGIERKFFILQPGGIVAYPPAAEFTGFSSPPVNGGVYVFGEKSRDAAYAREQVEKDLAESYFQAGIYDKAELGLRRALKDKPADEYSWLILGQVYLATGKYGKAIDSFSNAIDGRAGSLKPVWDALSHFYIGNCRDILAERKLALLEYEKVVASGIDYEALQERARKCILLPYVTVKKNF